jgi:hypothetical protein
MHPRAGTWKSTRAAAAKSSSSRLAGRLHHRICQFKSWLVHWHTVNGEKMNLLMPGGNCQIVDAQVSLCLSGAGFHVFVLSTFGRDLDGVFVRLLVQLFVKRG